MAAGLPSLRLGLWAGTAIAMGVGVVWIGYWADRAAFGSLAMAFVALFGLYAALLMAGRRGWLSYRVLVGWGIGLRALLLFSTPNLSDDVYRFVWDGRLAAQGIHPFALTPAQVMQSGQALVGITSELFEQLNSPHYYTVYPSVCQAVFWMAAKVFPENVSGAILIIKLFLLAAEGLAVWSLWRLRPGGWAAAAYALHPLAIVEVVGNAHFEGAMVAFLLTGLWCLHRPRWWWASAFWALAIAVKLLPLLFLPILGLALEKRARWHFLGGVMLFSALLFWPLWDWVVLKNLLNSLQLYFRRFAFNASVYYVLQVLLSGTSFEGVVAARLLGALLGLVVFAGVWLLAFCQRIALLDRMVWAAGLYLLLATTVHPWYVLVPFTLSLASERRPRWRFPAVWAAAVVLSYSHYAGGGFQEQYGWIMLEYAAVGSALALDLFQGPHRRGTAPTLVPPPVNG